MQFTYSYTGYYGHTLYIPKDATSTMAWLEEYAAWYKENKKN
jgi:hypothetical protein